MNSTTKVTSVMVIGILMTAFCTSAPAQEKREFSISSEGAKSRYIQQLSIDVDDIAGHQVRVLEVERVYAESNRPVIDGETLVSQVVRGTSNYIAGVGPNSGFTTLTTVHDDKIFLEWNGMAETKPTATGSKRGTGHAVSKIVGGTGRFAKLRGTAVDGTEFDTDPKSGYNRGTLKGEYWFER